MLKLTPILEEVPEDIYMSGYEGSGGHDRKLHQALPFHIGGGIGPESITRKSEMANHNSRVRDSHAHTRFTCGQQCMAQEYKTRMLGENNPHFKPGRERQCQYCHAIFRPQRTSKKYCSVECYRAARSHQKLTSKALRQSTNPIQLLFPFPVYWKKRSRPTLRLCPICQTAFRERRH